MKSQRPEISYNKILNSADAAVSADPNSFEYSTFTDNRYQLNGAFISDYERIDLISIATSYKATRSTASSCVSTLRPEVRSIVWKCQHALTMQTSFTCWVRVLLLNGEAGGPFKESAATRPPQDSIGSQTIQGTLAAGTYYYSYSYVDAFGMNLCPASPLLSR